MRLLPIPNDQIAFEQKAAVVAARADGQHRAGGVEGDVVDGKAQVVERGEGGQRVAAVQRDAISQRPAPVGGAGARVGQQREFRGDRRHVLPRVEEHAGNFSAAAQRGIHEGGHRKRLQSVDPRHALPDVARKRRGGWAGAGAVRITA
ncbi:hypothetical protein D3C72_1615210 [compost metagenome]